MREWNKEALFKDLIRESNMKKNSRRNHKVSIYFSLHNLYGVLGQQSASLQDCHRTVPLGTEDILPIMDNIECC